MLVPYSDVAVYLAAQILVRGGLVAFPTETVYGLGARADDAEAVKRIYSAKGRPSENPSIVHVASTETAFDLSAKVPAIARVLAAKFWPGPLTLVLRARPGAVADEVTAFGDTIALRVPGRAEALAILREAKVPVAAPSANRSSYISPTLAEHVLSSLGDRVDLIVDGGATATGIESTIVDLSSAVPRLLRHGSISFAELSLMVPALEDAARVVTRAGERAPAPGTQAKHYSPMTKFELVRSDQLVNRVAEARAQRLRVGVLAYSSGFGAQVEEVLSRHADEFARGLYAAMYNLDESECDLVLAESPPDGPEWDAVRDRLTRAASA